MKHLNDFRPELTKGISGFIRQIFADDVTYEKIHKHLTDPNDVITDQDLENIKTLMVPATERDFSTAVAGQ